MWYQYREMVANAHCFPVFLEWRHHWPNLAGCSHCMRDIQSFAMKPRLLILDEPVNGLDFQSTEYLYQQILGYKEYGTVLFSSHILESITLTSDRVFVLEDGKIRQTFEGGQINAADIREALHDENDR